MSTPKKMAKGRRVERPTFTVYAPGSGSDGVAVRNNYDRNVDAIRVNTKAGLYMIHVQDGKLCVRALETPVSPKRPLLISPVTPFDVLLIPQPTDG